MTATSLTLKDTHKELNSQLTKCEFQQLLKMLVWLIILSVKLSLKSKADQTSNECYPNVMLQCVAALSKVSIFDLTIK